MSSGFHKVDKQDFYVDDRSKYTRDCSLQNTLLFLVKETTYDNNETQNSYYKVQTRYHRNGGDSFKMSSGQTQGLVPSTSKIEDCRYVPEQIS